MDFPFMDRRRWRHICQRPTNRQAGSKSLDTCQSSSKPLPSPSKPSPSSSKPSPASSSSSSKPSSTQATCLLSSGGLQGTGKWEEGSQRRGAVCDSQLLRGKKERKKNNYWGIFSVFLPFLSSANYHIHPHNPQPNSYKNQLLIWESINELWHSNPFKTNF